MKNSIFLLVLCGCCVVHLASSRRAPDVAPNYPEGWCDLRYGTPTRSTGECICSRNCEGSGCRTESGVIWFAYAECPTCQCVSSDVKTRFTATRSEIKPRQEPEERGADEDQEGEEDEPEEAFDILDWIDENLNYVIAGGVTLVVLYICGSIISDALTSTGSEKTKTSAKKKSRKDVTSKSDGSKHSTKSD